MQPEPYAALVAAARRAHRNVASSAERALLQAAGWRKLAGGQNNSVYACEDAGQPLCLKLYKVDTRERAATEWRALNLLREHGYSRQPQPLHYSVDPTLPVVVMQLLVGAPLGEQQLTRAQLAELAASLGEMYAITYAATQARFWLAAGTPELTLNRLRTAYEQKMLGPSDPTTREAHSLLQAWLRSPGPDIVLQPAPLVFTRNDPNLANCLWAGQRIGMVDFENAGWNPISFDLADLLEHPQSRTTPDHEWGWFLSQLGLEDEELTRLRTSRQLLALFWLTRCWPTPAEGPSSPRRQQWSTCLERCRQLVPLT